jgi:DNA-directed RNA polymerase subunit RPC12/RpoP
MVYPFKCPKCKKEYEFNFSLNEYEKNKDKLKCEKCGEKLVRIYSVGIKTGDGVK